MDGNRQSTPVAFGDTPASGGYVAALLPLLSPLEGAVPKGPGEDAPTETDFPLHNIHFPLQHYTKLFHHTVLYLLA